MSEKTSNPKEFSKREYDVFQLLLQGKPNKEIASSLRISQKTVEEHLTAIYSKIWVSSRTEAILWGIEQLRDFPH